MALRLLRRAEGRFSWSAAQSSVLAGYASTVSTGSKLSRCRSASVNGCFAGICAGCQTPTKARSSNWLSSFMVLASAVCRML